ncbi:MAG: hypothetical protein LBK73_12970, partial [Treponema sp.]|nr:hypothetical protein [Treponema sp.]
MSTNFQKNLWREDIFDEFIYKKNIEDANEVKDTIVRNRVLINFNVDSGRILFAVGFNTPPLGAVGIGDANEKWRQTGLHSKPSQLHNFLAVEPKGRKPKVR